MKDQRANPVASYVVDCTVGMERGALIEKWTEALTVYAAAAVEVEREACARVPEALAAIGAEAVEGGAACAQVADAIRARGQGKSAP